MKTLVSEVLLPAAAAVGLLAMLAIPPATAEEPPASPADMPTLAAVGAPTQAARQTVAAQEAVGTATASRKPAVEARCERVERIGKYAFTRCE